MNVSMLGNCGYKIFYLHYSLFLGIFLVVKAHDAVNLQRLTRDLKLWVLEPGSLHCFLCLLAYQQPVGECCIR
jgi:hypothetical protein